MKSGVKPVIWSLNPVFILHYQHCTLFMASQSGCLGVFQTFKCNYLINDKVNFYDLFLVRNIILEGIFSAKLM